MHKNKILFPCSNGDSVLGGSKTALHFGATHAPIPIEYQRLRETYGEPQLPTLQPATAETAAA